MDKFVSMLLGLKMFVKQYHWLAKGYENHILADKLEEELDDYIDEAAELFAVSSEETHALDAYQVLERAKSFVQETKVVPDTMEDLRGSMIKIITSIMSYCRQDMGNNELKQPFGDYTGRLSNLLLRKLYLLDVQGK